MEILFGYVAVFSGPAPTFTVSCPLLPRVQTLYQRRLRICETQY